jgi:regulatory protein
MKANDKAKINYEPTAPAPAEAPAEAAAEAAAYHAATRLLCRRGHSRKELLLKLRQRGYEDTAIDAALERCERHNYIDDTATCGHYCRELIRKGQGPLTIRQRLVQRGFDRALIDTTIKAHYPSAIIHETAQAVAARKAGQLKARYKEKLDLRRRLARFLTQRGFPTEVIHSTLDRTIGT